MKTAAIDNPLTAHQLTLEEKFSKNQLLPRIRKEFTDCPEFMDFLKSIPVPEAFALDVVVQMALHKRADLPTMVGLTRYHYDNAQMAADMLLKCAEHDVVDWDAQTQKFIVRFTISDDVQLELDKFQYPLPMVIPPRKITTNKRSGYLTSHGSVILRNNHHDNDVNLDHLNTVNTVSFRINDVVAHMVKNEWRNLDRPKQGETEIDFKKRKRAFEKYDRTAKDVMQLLLVEGNQFYLTHKYDKRGRVYAQGYHVNYQGAPWNKAVIEFDQQEIIEP